MIFSIIKGIIKRLKKKIKEREQNIDWIIQIEMKTILNYKNRFTFFISKSYTEIIYTINDIRQLEVEQIISQIVNIQICI